MVTEELFSRREELGIDSVTMATDVHGKYVTLFVHTYVEFATLCGMLEIDNYDQYVDNNCSFYGVSRFDSNMIKLYYTDRNFVYRGINLYEDVIDKKEYSFGAQSVVYEANKLSSEGNDTVYSLRKLNDGVLLGSGTNGKTYKHIQTAEYLNRYEEEIKKFIQDSNSY